MTMYELMLFIVYLFQIVVLDYRHLQCVFAFPFSANCRCHCCVLALVYNHPTTHPQILTPDGYFSRFSNHSKVRCYVEKGFLIVSK